MGRVSGVFPRLKDAKDAKNAKDANPRELASLPSRLGHSRPRLCTCETSRNFAKLAETCSILRETQGIFMANDARL
jgi:hypothetical protein